ncbi:MAG: phosphatidylglycerophosphatase A [Acetobacterales bacterium]
MAVKQPSGALAGAGRRPTLWRPSMLVGTFFGVGLMPVAPATWGSLATLPLAWLLMRWGGPAAILLAAALLFLLAMWAIPHVCAAVGKPDPGRVVIDEVIGQLLAVAAVPADLTVYAVAFFLFRAVDIAKPWPADWADSEVPGALGVLLDDVIAGLYVCPLAALAAWLLGVWW